MNQRKIRMAWISLIFLIFLFPLKVRADIHNECRTRYFDDNAGENDDSYYVRTIEITDNYNDVSNTYIRYVQIDGDQSVRLFLNEDDRDNCRIYQADWPHEEYAGCAIDAFRNFALWFGHSLNFEQAQNVITTIEPPDWLVSEEFEGNILTLPSDFETDLQIWFNAYFLDTDVYYQVQREHYKDVKRIVEILSAGHPVIALVDMDTGAKVTHWIVITGMHYNPNINKVQFHVQWNEEENRWYSADELQDLLYFNEDLEFWSHKRGTLIWVQTDNKQFIEVIGSAINTFSDCATKLARASKNRFDYSYIFFNNDTCTFRHPNTIDDDPETAF